MARKPWSYSAGARKTGDTPSSVVRVYERPDLPGRICYTLAWDRSESRRPRERYLPEGTTRAQAKEFADWTASDRRREIIVGRDVFALDEPDPVTVGDLFAAYEDSEEAAGWSDRHANDVAFSLRFWRRELGEEAEVMALRAARVEKIAGDAGRAEKRSTRWPRKRLAHLRAAVRWGWRKAGLYDRNPLEGVELPEYEPDTDELIYSPEETLQLLEPHPDIDWRVTLLANIAADTGRRLSAILALTTEDVVTDGERVFLHFRAAFDKGGRSAMVPLSQPTAERLADALEEDVVQEWGWIFPEGRLGYDDPRDKPWGPSAAIGKIRGGRPTGGLRLAERVLGIPYVEGRGYHGIKRRHVTTSMEVSSGDTALVGDVTGNLSAELLRKVYRKANRQRTSRHVDAVRKALQEAQESPESARESTRTGDDE